MSHPESADGRGKDEVSPGGSRMLRHEKRTVPARDSSGDGELIDAVSDHMERCVGPIDLVWHEIVSDLVHLDIHWIKPSAARPYHVLFTTGMAEAPMTMPEGTEPRRAELLTVLPPDWKLSQEDFKNEANFWPLRWLKIAARLPHEYDTWLGPGHTIPNGDPPKPFAPGTNLSGVMMTLPYILDPKDAILRHQGRDVHLLYMMPLTAAEMGYKLSHGSDALNEKIDALGLQFADLAKPGRPCAIAGVKKRARWWPFR